MSPSKRRQLAVMRRRMKKLGKGMLSLDAQKFP